MSNAVRDTIRAASAIPGAQVSVFTGRCERPELTTNIVEDAAALQSHQDYRDADVIIYHFGFHSPLFDVLAAGNGHAAQCVFFHNITPPDVAPDWLQPGIRESFEQLPLLRHADELWPFSRTNADVLLGAGMDASRITIIPPVVPWPRPGDFAAKEAAPVRVLFVGRMIASKGVTDLLRAILVLSERDMPPYQVTLAGNEVDPEYAMQVRKLCEAAGPHVTFAGRVDDAELEQLYADAHVLAIPSYHEGFCRPVIEGLRAGCIPVGYASYEIPTTAAQLGRLAPTGNIAGLADALHAVISAVGPSLRDPATARLPLDRGETSAAGFDAAARRHVAQFAFGPFAARLRTRVRATKRNARRRNRG